MDQSANSTFFLIQSLFKHIAPNWYALSRDGLCFPAAAPGPGICPVNDAEGRGAADPERMRESGGVPTEERRGEAAERRQAAVKEEMDSHL